MCEQMLFCMLFHTICYCLFILYSIHFLHANFTMNSLCSCWVWKWERDREGGRKREIKMWLCQFSSHLYCSFLKTMCLCVCVCVWGGGGGGVNSVIHYTSFSGGRKIGHPGDYENCQTGFLQCWAKQKDSIHTHTGAPRPGDWPEGNTRVLHFTQRHRLFYTSRAGLRSGQFSRHNSYS